METKFTKGEWGACCLDEIPHYVFGEGGESICHIEHNDIIADVEFYEPLMETVTIEEARANAKLIAAAPYLFKVCKSIIALKDLILPPEPVDGISEEYKDEFIYINKVLNDAETAIKKATE